MSIPLSLLTSVQSSIIPRTVCFKILPSPTRTWNRVQGECSLFVDTNSSFNQNMNQTVTIPLTGKVVSSGNLAQELAMLNKGNVLQYKKNSSNLTKKQQYALIAQGKWVNRKTWGTQSASGYTNPNTKGLQRVNSVDLAIDVGAVEPIIIQDLGNLVCGTLENPVTGQVIFRQPKNDFCFPTYCSDVPGPITDLCWNDGIVPWFPRTRTTMSVSGDKFPINATLISAAVIDPPILTLASYTDTTVTLSWTIPESGLPITSFIVYQNINGTFVPITSVLGKIDPITNLIELTTIYTVTGITNGQLHAFYVTSVSNTQPTRSESKPSNIVINSEQIFTVTGNPRQYVIDNIYVIEFTQSGQLTINNGISILSTIFCMGGGGAGGLGSIDASGGGGGGGGITTVYNIVSGTYVITVGLGGVTNVSNGVTSQIVKGIITILSAAGGTNGSNAQINSIYGSNGGKSGTQESVGGTGATVNNNATSGTLGGGGGGGGGTNAYSNSGAPGSTNVPFGPYNRTDFGLGGHGGNTYSLSQPLSGLANTGCGGGGGTSVNLLGGSGGSGLVLLYFSL
jgi:hypothetical protein